MDVVSSSLFIIGYRGYAIVLKDGVSRTEGGEGGSDMPLLPPRDMGGIFLSVGGVCWWIIGGSFTVVAKQTGGCGIVLRPFLSFQDGRSGFSGRRQGGVLSG